MKWAGLMAVALGMALIVSSVVWVEAAHREVIGAVLVLGGLLVWRLSQVEVLLSQCRDVLDQSRDRLTRNNVSLGQVLARLNALLAHVPATASEDAGAPVWSERRTPGGRLRRSRAPNAVPPPVIMGACPRCQTAGPLGQWCEALECQGLFEFVRTTEVPKAQAVARWTGSLPKVEVAAATDDLQLDAFPPIPDRQRSAEPGGASVAMAPGARPPVVAAASRADRAQGGGSPADSSGTMAKVLRRADGSRRAATTARMASASLPAPPVWDDRTT